jgi:hypothetical protein
VSHTLALIIESLVAILLMITIWYCVSLNKRLIRLRADEHALKATISELITATEIAERAIGGLKQTMREGEQVLTSRLQRSEDLSNEIDKKMKAAEALLGKLARIATIGRPAPEPEVATPPDPKAVAAAAQAFTERARARLSGMAA